MIHSGVVGWIEETDTDWQLQFRRSFELGNDHELWVWPSQSETPRVLDRSTWWQDDDVCHIRPESGVALVALAVSFKGSWLGARTSAQGMGWILQPPSFLHKLEDHGTLAQVVARTSAASGAKNRCFRIGESSTELQPSTLGPSVTVSFRSLLF